MTSWTDYALRQKIIDAMIDVAGYGYEGPSSEEIADVYARHFPAPHAWHQAMATAWPEHFEPPPPPMYGCQTRADWLMNEAFKNIIEAHGRATQQMINDSPFFGEEIHVPTAD
jgi:hypothetical protein